VNIRDVVFNTISFRDSQVTTARRGTNPGDYSLSARMRNRADDSFPLASRDSGDGPLQKQKRTITLVEPGAQPQ